MKIPPLVALRDRLTQLVHRPTPAGPPPYRRCDGCNQSTHPVRDSQNVPDPAAFTGLYPGEEHGGVIATVQAAPIWCAPCGAWFHAVDCYSRHHTPGWEPARERPPTGRAARKVRQARAKVGVL